MATASKERAEVESIDEAIVILVYGSVSSIRCEVISDLEVSFEDVKSALQIDFFFNYIE